MIEKILGSTGLDCDAAPPQRETAFKRALIAFVLLFGLWTVFGLLSSVHFFFQGGADARFGETASHVVVFYWGWAILTPAVILLTRRVTSARYSVWRRAGVLALVGVVVVAVHSVLHPLLIRILGVDSQAQIDLAGLRSFGVRHGGGDLATFAVLVGAHMLFDASRRERGRAFASVVVQQQLARAELEVLRWQLHPHFLFNALNTVSTLVLKGDRDSADRAIGLIALYLRHALAQRADSMVPLREELATVNRYVDVERLRFGDTLTIQESVEASALDAYVPGLILQPLVENAIRHGIGRTVGQGPIRITAAIDSGRLCIGVTNPRVNGAPNTGLDEAWGHNAVHSDADGQGSTQFGLRYVRERLHQFYGATASFDLVLGSSESTATLNLPFATSGAVDLRVEDSEFSRGPGE
jgi:two-component system, LytTR family, sensor kinase